VLSGTEVHAVLGGKNRRETPRKGKGEKPARVSAGLFSYFQTGEGIRPSSVCQRAKGKIRGIIKSGGEKTGERKRREATGGGEKPRILGGEARSLYEKGELGSGSTLETTGKEDLVY